MPVELARLMQRFRRMRIMERFGESLRGEFFALDWLDRFEREHPEVPGMYVSALAAEMEMSAPGMSRLLKGMEAMGHIERTVDPQSRRNTYIHLTDKGRETLCRIRGRLCRYQERVASAMGEEELRQLTGLLSRLLDCMEQESNSLDDGEVPCSKS